ncbi:RNA polymerase subunit AC19 [Naganishia albida]|nr:RNA polymerase subunit AC19 [Naganishia albida]
MEQSSFSDPVERQPKGDKITILPGHAADYSEATFCLMEEDHTLGNALRWMVMKNPDVEFCGYSAPHPSEPKIHLRIQMYDNLSAITCLFEALANLRNLFSSIDEAYQAALADDSYVIEEDTDIKARVAAIAQEAAERRARAAGTAGDVTMG